MFNWNDIIVEQKIAQERYQEIVQAKQIARAEREQGDSDPQEVSFYYHLRNWVTNAIANLGYSPQPSLQCCTE